MHLNEPFRLVALLIGNRNISCAFESLDTTRHANVVEFWRGSFVILLRSLRRKYLGLERGHCTQFRSVRVRSDGPIAKAIGLQTLKAFVSLGAANETSAAGQIATTHNFEATNIALPAK
jgi:hypothetical protein